MRDRDTSTVDAEGIVTSTPTKRNHGTRESWNAKKAKEQAANAEIDALLGDGSAQASGDAGGSADDAGAGSGAGAADANAHANTQNSGGTGF
jgi:hypothetical protein